MPEVSTRTLTFLFTDIEGSTGLWEEHPEAMSVALADHDRLLSETIEARGGRVFKTVGDSFCAAFTAPAGALAAAEAAQRALQVRQWEVPGGLRVRMALHTGAAEERSGDYFGPTLNRVARLLSAGHGGQVLLSEATKEAVGELPEACILRDLGERRLKDLVRPERVFEFVAAGLAADFPPLKTLDARQHNLPLQPGPLIGREEEVKAAVELLRGGQARLVTMTGAGGSGKTRLALQVGAELIDDFEAGVFFVPLAAIADSGLVPSVIAQQLSLREAADRPVLEVLKQHLRDKEILLLLDNFEQLLPAARQVAELLESCPRLKVLVTSRSCLRVRAECEFAVQPLALPDLREEAEAHRLLECAAVTLFIERASVAKQGFRLTGENSAAIAEICVRLDGLPLAIELAAARCKVLPPQAMLERLGRRLELLTGGARDLPERQQTLRRTIDWSYDLLSDEQKALFRRLSVFVGGFTLAAAEVVVRAPEAPPVDLLDGVASLADNSLLRQEEEEGEPRFYMLETVREYALEALAENSEEAAVRGAHAAVFLALAQEAEPRLEGADEAFWLERLERDHDNLRAALNWLAGSGDVESALRLAASLCLFWFMRGHLSEGRQRILDLLAFPAAKAPTACRARALNRGAFLTRFLGDYTTTHELISESLGIYRQLDDRQGIADALSNLGDAALYAGDLEETERLHSECLEINRSLANRQGIADSLSHLGMSAFFRGELAQAEALHRESLEIWKDLGDRQGVSWALHKLGVTMLRLGEVSSARAMLSESLATAHELDYSYGIAWTLEGLADVEVALGRPKRAVRLAAAAASLREEIAAPVPSLWGANLARTLEEARAVLDAESHEAEWDEGGRMELAEAIAWALGQRAPG